jgi:hypothetical protein
MHGRTIVADMGGGVSVSLRLNGAEELRASMSKPRQSEDIEFVFIPADSPESGKGVH